MTGTVGMAVAALALALQPDRAMAGVLVAGLLAVALSARSGLAALAAAVAGLAFGWTLSAPDTLPVVPYADQVFLNAFGVHPLAGVAVVAGAAVLLLPASVRIVGRATERPALLAFGGRWLSVIAAAALGDYPTPLVGYGGAAVLGYLLSVALLPSAARETGRSLAPESEPARGQNSNGHYLGWVSSGGSPHAEACDWGAMPMITDACPDQGSRKLRLVGTAGPRGRGAQASRQLGTGQGPLSAQSGRPVLIQSGGQDVRFRPRTGPQANVAGHQPHSASAKVSFDTIERPLHVGDRPSGNASNTFAHYAGQSSGVHMARILIVDDEADVRATLRTMLERGGYSVFEACDGDEALKQFETCAPNLIIIDMMMPKRDGIETIRDLRKAGAATPIIAITGGGRLGYSVVLEAASLLGADQRVAKPVRRAELLAAVDACLSSAD